MLANVADITAPDAETVVITLSKPDALFEYALASTAAHVVNKAFVEANGDKYGTPAVGSIGTGPFKFVEWVSGDHQTLARFDDYWDKANGGPYLDTVTIKILPEPTTRVAGLDTGEIDYLVNNVPSDQYATVAGDGQRVALVRALVLRRVDHVQHRRAAVRQRQGPPGAQLRGRQEGHPPAVLRTRHAGHEGDPRLPHACGRSTSPSGRPPGTRCRPTTRTSRRRKQLLDESGVADQLNGKTIAYYESTPSIKGIGESFIDSMSKLGIDIKAQKVTYQEAVSLQFGAARRLRHPRRLLGLGLPRSVRQPASELRVREHRGRWRERIRLYQPRRSTRCWRSRTRWSTRPSGRSCSSRPRRSSPRTRR